MPETPDTFFSPPGPGMWDLDRSHYPGGTTLISQWLLLGCAEGMRTAFAEYGVPAETIEVRFVQGFMYSRLRPLVRPDRPATRLPPLPILKLAMKLHPTMRARTKQAERTLQDRPWRRIVAEWNRTIRPRLEQQNATLRQVDERSLDDAALACRLERLLAHCRANFALHFYLHMSDLEPTGLLFYDCHRLGIEPHEVIPALAGSSPATRAPAVALAHLRRCVEASGRRPASLDEIREISTRARDLLDEYLNRTGRLMVSRYDVDGLTLDEAPRVVLATILDGARPPATDERAAEVASALRARIPSDQQARFDDRLADARAAMNLRDDNGPNTQEFPIGLLRHALLEAGRRLHQRDCIDCCDDVFELAPDEVVPLIRDGRGPTAAELATRAQRRSAQQRLVPPARLGPEEPPPPLEVFAPAHEMLVGAVRLVLTHLGMAGARQTIPLAGYGVGTTMYRGRARVAHDPERALAAMEPGEVLVTRSTNPAYNTVLVIAGALVTAEGGLLSHAAVIARELGIPAVIGAPGALDQIGDGSMVEVDPIAGLVRVVGG